VILAEIATEIAPDRDSRREIMSTLGVSEDALEAAVGQAAELVGRPKSNGVLTHYSRSSRVVELEGLLAGLDAKRDLWHSCATPPQRGPCSTSPPSTSSSHGRARNATASTSSTTTPPATRSTRADTPEGGG
jgi:hypothetical protein